MLRNQIVDLIDRHHDTDFTGDAPDVDALADMIMELLADRGLPTHDPTDLDGAIVGDVGQDDGRPGGVGGVVLDTRNAIIPDYTTCAVVDNAAPETFAAVLIEGRINRRRDRARVMLIGSGDALAAWLTELLQRAASAKASPMSTHRRWAREFERALAERTGARPGPVCCSSTSRPSRWTPRRVRSGRSAGPARREASGPGS